jgi:hypothetical protein
MVHITAEVKTFKHLDFLSASKFLATDSNLLVYNSTQCYGMNNFFTTISYDCSIKIITINLMWCYTGVRFKTTYMICPT